MCKRKLGWKINKKNLMLSSLQYFIHDIKNNLLFYFFAFCLISSSLVIIPYGIVFYMIGLFFMFVFTFKYKVASKEKRLSPFLIFVMACILSSFVSGLFDYRLLTFIITIFCCTPLMESRKVYEFREKYLKYSLQIFPLISLISLWCYYRGINYFQTEDIGQGLDFSGIFPHPLWLGAAVGLANVVLCWQIFEAKNKLGKVLLLLFLIMSIYVSVISASRSALISSLVVILLYLFLRTRKIKKTLCYLLIAAAIGFISYPFLSSRSQRIMYKNEQSEGKYGSRTGIWQEGFRHFENEPIFGSGFGTKYDGEEKKIGRLESGSGWLSVLFQTGIVGFVSLLFILLKAKKNIKYILKNHSSHLYLLAFVFLCLHSLFEGYILTSGYYLCILFWMLLGYIYSYKKYRINYA